MTSKIFLFTILLAVLVKLGVAYSSEPENLNTKKYDSNTGFVIDNGYKITTTHCTACHSAQIIIQQGQTRSGWLELIKWMQEEQDLWEIPKEQLELILNYLATNYGEDRPNFKKEK
jgi:mono/diheme cytochrome c family protein